MITSEQIRFSALLSDLKLPPKVDMVFVMRNWAQDITEARLASASKLVMDRAAGMLVMVNAEHSQEEAILALDMAYKQGGSSIAICTQPYHMVRAYLTFLQAAIDGRYLAIRLYPYPSFYSSGPIDEEEKITLYQEKGHVASFKKGIDYICSLRETAA